ncbi:MAG: hypothetical protein LBQ84_03670 [Flavobacteriaceae bacterium]|jgi:hypothetical protein|nr:hypothetical protein [Flavobacteriaceae bacterium]
MKKVYFILLITIFCALPAAAQIAVGGSKPAYGAILDLNSPNHDRNVARTIGGLLLSNIWLDKVTHIPGGERFVGIPNELGEKEELRGMVVWNINPSIEGGNGMGPYVWDGDNWKYLGTVETNNIGRMAYIEGSTVDAPIVGWYYFMTYNLGAENKSIDEQKTFKSDGSNGFPVVYTNTNAANAAKYTPIYGSLYQWGRREDGHQNVWSSLYDGQVPEDDFKTPNGKEWTDKFVITDNVTGDWIAGASKTNRKRGRWGGRDNNPNENDVSFYNRWNSKGANDPCPDDFRVPMMEEWAGTLMGKTNGYNWSYGAESDTNLNYYGANRWEYYNNSDGTIGWLVYPPKEENIGKAPQKNSNFYAPNPTLFFPAAGFRGGSYYEDFYNGDHGWGASNLGHINKLGRNGAGHYWSGTTSAISEFSYGIRLYLTVNSSGNTIFSVISVSVPRATAFSVRCIKYKNLSTP